MENGRKRILFFDDERSRIYAFVLDLRSVSTDNKKIFAVSLYNDPETALERILKEKYDLAVIDIEAPSVSGSTIFTMQATKGGTETGIVLYNHLRKAKPELPVVFITHRQRDRFLFEFREILEDRNTKICAKCDTLPEQLTTIIAHMLGIALDQKSSL